MEGDLLNFLMQKIFTESSLVAVIFCAMWVLEKKEKKEARADTREAWGAHNELAKEMSDTVKKFTVSLELLKAIVELKGRSD